MSHVSPIPAATEVTGETLMKGDWTRSHPFVSVCGLPCSTNLCPGNGVTSQSLRNRVGVTKGEKSEQGHMDNLCLLYNLRPHNIDFTCAFHVGVVGPRPHRRCMYLYRDLQMSSMHKNEPNYSQTRIPKYWDKQKRTLSHFRGADSWDETNSPPNKQITINGRAVLSGDAAQ